jgi:methionyl-tRNA formyltransferase
MGVLKVVILTSFENPTLSKFLDLYSRKEENRKFEIVGVIRAQQTIQKTKKFYFKKFQKVLKIGILGTLNGIRMRKWYQLPSAPPIQMQCQKFNIPYHEVSSINHQDTASLITKIKPDLGVSMGNSYIAKRIFSIPQEGFINIHGEILPAYQNAQSVIWQLYNASKETGYTIHEVDNKIDHGAILLQEKYDIEFSAKLSATVNNTIQRTSEKSNDGLFRLLSDFQAFMANKQFQKGGNAYTTPSIWQFLKIVFNHSKLRK